jgi:hypothetical protein
MKSTLKYSGIFALIFPFWSMIASVRFFNSNYSKNLFWYGCAFMGFLHIFNPVGGSGSDGIRYAAALVTMYYNPLDLSTIMGYFYVEGGKLDIYQVIVTFFTSLFTKDPHYLFLLFAIVFGYFYSRNIWLILNKCTNENLKWWVWLIIIAYIFINPVWNINGVRMYTAMHVFFYGVLSYYLSDNKKKIFWVFLSPFFHFSFFIPAIFFAVYLFLPKSNLTIYFILFFCSSVFNEIQIESIRNYIESYVPAIFNRKLNSYMNENYAIAAKEGKESFALYILISKKLVKVFVYSIIVLFWINSKKLFENKTHKSFLTMYLFMGSIFQFLSSIPSFHRFDMLQMLFFYALLLLVLLNKNISENILNKYIKYLIILLFLPILFDIRKGFDFYGVSLLCGNFISAFFIDDRLPLIDIIKSIF